jgi:hypothetical protein
MLHLNRKEKMQPTVKSSYTDFQDSVNRYPSHLFKPLRKLIVLVPLLLVCILVSIAPGQSKAQTPASPPTNPAAQSEAKKMFEKMKTLAGSWQGTIMGISINATIRLASSGTAILHEATTDGGGPPNHEITMFYVDGDRLLTTHYCDGGNRARLEGKMSPDGKTIEFSFLDVVGSTKGGLVKRMVFTMTDTNKHVIEISFIMPDGKPIDLRGEFQRSK